MGCEDNIVRTTIYLERWIHEKNKKERRNNKHFSVSKFVNEQFRNYYHGDEYELQAQLNKLENRLQELQNESEALLSRKTELTNKLESSEIEQKREKKLYDRFISNVNGRLRNMKELNVAPDYNQICNHFHRSFFPDNNVDVGTVKQIMHMVKTDKMSFEVFQDIRKGEFVGN